MTEPTAAKVDTAADTGVIRDRLKDWRGALVTSEVLDLCDEVDRLRAALDAASALTEAADRYREAWEMEREFLKARPASRGEWTSMQRIGADSTRLRTLRDRDALLRLARASHPGEVTP